MTTPEKGGSDLNLHGGDSRGLIFESIRQSLATSAPFDHAHARDRSHISDKAEPSLHALSDGSLINNFKNNLESVGGHCSIVSNESEAAEAVQKTINNLSATQIAISDSPLVASIADQVAGAEIVRNAGTEFLFRSDIGITGAQWAIAETGTLVLVSDVERHRLISLVPPVHICILKANSVRQTLGEILELVQRDLSRTVTFITGASRTSDIELTLAIGVHGPRELHVILIVDQIS